MRQKTLIPAAALLICLAGFAANSNNPGIQDTKAAFARLRSLAGQ
jgi:hypothetical protein